MAIELISAQQDLVTRRATLHDVFGAWKDRTDLPDLADLRKESDERSSPTPPAPSARI